MFLLESNNIFTYTGHVAAIDQWFDIRDLKRNYDILRIVENHYDKILWVCFHLLWENYVNFNLFSVVHSVIYCENRCKMQINTPPPPLPCTSVPFPYMGMYPVNFL